MNPSDPTDPTTTLDLNKLLMGAYISDSTLTRFKHLFGKVTPEQRAEFLLRMLNHASSSRRDRHPRLAKWILSVIPSPEALVYAEVLKHCLPTATQAALCAIAAVLVPSVSLPQQTELAVIIHHKARATLLETIARSL